MIKVKPQSQIDAYYTDSFVLNEKNWMRISRTNVHNSINVLAENYFLHFTLWTESFNVITASYSHFF